jgi:hypothetical protein
LSNERTDQLTPPTAPDTHRGSNTPMFSPVRDTNTHRETSHNKRRLGLLPGSREEQRAHSSSACVSSGQEKKTEEWERSKALSPHYHNTNRPRTHTHTHAHNGSERGVKRTTKR